MPFEVRTAGRIVVAGGASKRLGELTRDLGRRALVVTGRSADRVRDVTATLEAAGVQLSYFAVAGEPDVQMVQAGVACAREQASDLVIGIGGGSAIDAAKAIAVLTPLDADLFDHLEVIGRGQPLASAGLPCVAVPTTAGTGSETTRNAVLMSPTHRLKVSLRSPFMIPRLAVVDPELTRDLPPALTAATGLDALTQLVEPYLSVRANPFTDALCLEGLPRVARSLRVAFHDGANARAREDMAVASLFSGMALANAGLGAVHGFAGTIGGLSGAPHGAICAALLPSVLEGNLRALDARAPGHPARSRLEVVGRLLTGSPTASAHDAIDWVQALVDELGIRRVGSYGLAATDVPAVVAQATRSSSMQGNPIVLTTDELEGMLQSAL